MSKLLKFMALLLLATISTACGALTAPVSLPLTIARNHNFAITGRLLDPEGNPLEGVTMDVSGYRQFWDPGSGHSERLETTSRVGPKFRISQRADALNVTFSRPGYDDLLVTFYGDRVGFGYGHWGTYALQGPVTFILHPRDTAKFVESAGLRYVTDRVVSDQQTLLPYGLPGSNETTGSKCAINIDSFAAANNGWLYSAVLNNPPSAGSFYTTVRRVEPAHGKPSEEITLHLSAPDGGFIRFIPNSTDFPLAQMRQAPADGYQPSITIPAARLAEMLTPRSQEQDEILKHYEFYYFRANGKYGRMAMHRPDYSTGPGFDFTIEIERSGSRDLPYVPGW